MICDLKPSEINRAFKNGETFFNELTFACEYDYDAKGATDLLIDLTSNPNGIALIDDATDAFILGTVQKHWFCSAMIAYDYCMYVPKEHRGKGTAYKLIKAYVERAKELGATEIYVSDMGDIDRDAVQRIYKKLGFKPNYTTYSLKAGGI